MINIIEFSFTLGQFANAMLFIPQAYKIFKAKTSRGISFITFFGFWIIQLSTLFHGYAHKDIFLIYGTLASMCTCGLVVLITLYYRLFSTEPK